MRHFGNVQFYPEDPHGGSSGSMWTTAYSYTPDFNVGPGNTAGTTNIGDFAMPTFGSSLETNDGWHLGFESHSGELYSATVGIGYDLTLGFPEGISVSKRINFTFATGPLFQVAICDGRGPGWGTAASLSVQADISTMPTESDYSSSVGGSLDFDGLASVDIEAPMGNPSSPYKAAVSYNYVSMGVGYIRDDDGKWIASQSIGMGINGSLFTYWQRTETCVPIYIWHQ